MDEPFANVDPSAKEELFDEIRRISKATDTTVVLVTHDGADALALSDKVIFLSEGSLQQYSETKSCYYHPATLQVASFLGPLVEIPAALISDMKIDTRENQQAYIRPERIRITDKSGHQMKVVDNKWRGFYHLYYLEDEKGNKISWYSSDARHKKGDFVEISLSEKDLLWF
jgi:ABC-type Fe3+/spermidine/putrescine transport system ATPase subunit